MNTLVFIDNNNGSFKKAAFEAIFYAKQYSTNVTALVLGSANADALAALASYGATQILHTADSIFETLDSQAYTNQIVAAAKSIQADTVVFSNISSAKLVAPRVAAALQAGLVSGVLSIPDTSNGFLVKKSVFAGKAFANVQINSAVKVIAISPNSFKPVATEQTANVTAFASVVNAVDLKIKVTNVAKAAGKVPLPEAELVVSGGRGLKGPENWGILEELATALGAETACSRPVADSHWRPHNEHVGQTGGTIRPNLYVAIGISGAIQHLAGVNASKTIVVINKDPEAPFFKAADYGICADAFDVLPRFTEAVKKFKASHA
jgi:electron transfer flavoprotein alpha subunit